MVNSSDTCINSRISRVIFKLKLYRELANFSQAQLASSLSMSLRTYQRIENGDASLDLGMCFKISKILNIEIDDWLDDGCCELEPNIKIINSYECYNLSFTQLNLISQFEKINSIEEVYDYSSSDLFKRFSDPGFVCINTKKIANEKSLMFINIEKTTKITSGYQDPCKIIKFLDQVNYHRPEYTYIYPIALESNSEKDFCSINIHKYLDSNILILSLLLPKN